MSNSWGFQDRRGMFQPGREVHEPSRRSSQGAAAGVVETVRKASVSAGNTVNAALEKTTSNTSTATGTAGRRRSSASSGMFAGLNSTKRGSTDYGDRRGSHGEQEGAGGAVSGWYNKTFRGIAGVQQTGGEDKRGVME